VCKIKNQEYNSKKVIKDLAVYILFYEKLEQTIECIHSFLPSGVSIYILNNGSSSSARDAIGKFCDNYKQIKIFDSDVNLGVAVGRNYLIRHTSEKWLFCVDNDITIKTKKWVHKFINYLSLYPNIKVFTPRLYNIRNNRYRGNISFFIIGDIIIVKTVHDDKFLNSFPGGASIINRELFNKFGFFDDKMFVEYEDYEFCIRAILLGNSIKVMPIYNIELVHDHRQVKEYMDNKTILARYNLNSQKKSYNRIIEKHNLFLDVDYQIGTFNLAKKMLKGNSSVLLKEQKKIITHKNEGILKRNRKMIKSFISFIIPSCIKGVVKKIFHIDHKETPRSCLLYLTNKNNLKYIDYYKKNVRLKESNEMKIATIKKMLSLYPNLKVFTITGFGEPTLCSDFSDIVNFLKKKEKFVGINTDGLSFKEFLKLIDYPNYISIKLYGYDKQSYINNTGVDIYSKVIENFIKLKKKFKNVGFLYILNRENYKDLEKILLLCDELKPKYLNLQNYFPYNSKDKKETNKVITVKDLKIINYIDKNCAKHNYVESKPVYIDFDNPKYYCKSYKYMISLDYTGNIGGCLRQILPNIYFGNIYKDKDPFNSIEMKRLRVLMHQNCYIHKECQFCFENWR